jgi:hypothetical protein
MAIAVFQILVNNEQARGHVGTALQNPYYCSILTARVELKKIVFAKSQGWGVIQESEPN